MTMHITTKQVACAALTGMLLLTPTFGLSNDFGQFIDKTTQSKKISADESSQSNWWAIQTKEKKLLYTNLVAITSIGVWGLISWDYGSGTLHKANEGWFAEDSKSGGADKLGHFWATYVIADALTGVYKHWGYGSKKANSYAALSSWTIQAVMEFMDGTSDSQGFSWEDIAMNTLGALSSMLMERYPDLDKKIDFRVEYTFNVDINGILDDYSNHFYAVVLKLEGFESIQNSLLQYLEIHGGYYTRGYEDKSDQNQRALYAGISFNFSRLFKQKDWDKTAKALEYLQIPYTVPKASHYLN